MKSTLVALVVAGTTLAAPGEWRVGESAVRVICPMTVGGSFDVKAAALSGSVTASPSGSSAFDGSLAVDRPPHARYRHRSAERASPHDLVLCENPAEAGSQADLFTPRITLQLKLRTAVSISTSLHPTPLSTSITAT